MLSRWASRMKLSGLELGQVDTTKLGTTKLDTTKLGGPFILDMLLLGDFFVN